VKPGDIKTRIRVFTGEADPIVPPEQVAGFKAEMDNARADYILVSYPDVMHTFTNREADIDSWAQTLEFLKETLK
jgi:dienelactone hydrolase